MIKIAFIDLIDELNKGWRTDITFGLLKYDLEKKGHFCDIIRLFKNELIKKKQIRKQLESLLKEKEYELVGMSSSTSCYIAGLIRVNLPKAKILLGGTNAIFSIDSQYYDFLITGPARTSVPALVEAIQGNKKINDVANLFFRKGKQISHSNKKIDFDLYRELFPYCPKFEYIALGSSGSYQMEIANIVGSFGCPYSRYIRKNKQYLKVKSVYQTPKNLDRTAKKHFLNEVNIPHKGCSFCNISLDRKCVALEPKKTIKLLLNQIYYLNLNYPSIRRFQINDENPFRYIDNLMFEVVRSGTKASEFLLRGRIDYFINNARRIITALKYLERTKYILNMGCLGFENFSQKELNIYNKGTYKIQNIKALMLLDKLSKDFPYNFRKGRDHGTILFNPWTTKEDLKENLEYYQKYKISELVSPLYSIVTRLAIYPYTPVYYKALGDGLISGTKCPLRYYRIPWRFKHKETDVIYKKLKLFFNHYKKKLKLTYDNKLKLELMILEKLVKII